LTPFGLHNVGQVIDRTCVYVTESGKLPVKTPYDEGAASFAAASKDALDNFPAASLANGGRDEGAPGPRPNASANHHGAYLRDPVGNKICASSQLPA